MIAIAREKEISAYVGAGLNRWPAVHRLDAARLYGLALEKGSAGAKYDAVAEEGVSVRKTAEAIGRGLNTGRGLVTRRGRRSFRLARVSCQHGRSGVERANPATAGMAPDRGAWVPCRSRALKRI